MFLIHAHVTLKSRLTLARATHKWPGPTPLTIHKSTMVWLAVVRASRDTRATAPQRLGQATQEAFPSFSQPRACWETTTSSGQRPNTPAINNSIWGKQLFRGIHSRAKNGWNVVITLTLVLLCQHWVLMDSINGISQVNVLKQALYLIGFVGP